MSDDDVRSARNGPLLGKPLDVLEFQLRLNELLSDITFFDGGVTLHCARRQQEVLLGKYPDLPSLGFDRIDTRKAALGTFVACEANNRATNERLKRWMVTGQTHSMEINRVLMLARSRFQSVLEGAFSVDGIPASFGPGSTSSLRYTEASLLAKCSHAQPECTEPLLKYRDVLISLLPHLPPPAVSVGGGVLSFVPKDSKTDRTILIEPDWNILVQKGLGVLLRDSLKRVAGLDIEVQQFRHHDALLADRSRSLATLDLANASNSLSMGVVRLLSHGMRSRHAIAIAASLEAARSPAYRMSRKSTTYFDFEMWSSMGNGYTFELETAIFWSLADACTAVVRSTVGLAGRGFCSVYGDDIIVDVAVVPLLTEVLTFCGFTLNPAKSFWTGPFRESCGLEVFNTIDVSPFRIKRVMETHGQVYWLANSLRQWWARLSIAAASESIRLPSVVPLWSWVWQHIPAGQRLKGPETLDSVSYAPDGYLHVDMEYCPPGRKPRHQLQGRLYQCWLTEPATVPFDSIETADGTDLIVPLGYALHPRKVEARRVSHYTPPSPDARGSYNGQSFSTECQIRGRGETRKGWVTAFTKPLPGVVL